MNESFSSIAYAIIGAYSNPKYAHVKFSMKPLGDAIWFEVLGDDDESLLVEMKMLFTDEYPIPTVDMRVSVMCDGKDYHRDSQFRVYVLEDLCMRNSMSNLLDVIVNEFSKFDNEYSRDVNEWRAHNLVNMVTSGILNLK